MDSPPAPEPKTVWRRWARAVREQVDWREVGPRIVAGLVDELTGRDPGMLLGFAALPDEVDLDLLAARLPGWQHLLTRTPDRGGDLTVHAASGPMERHRYGFLQPADGAVDVDPLEVDCVLVPGLVFDVAGGRIGRGAGYYDRLLSRMRRDVITIGIVPDALVVARVPTGPHDVHVTHLGTETGVRRVAGPV